MAEWRKIGEVDDDGDGFYVGGHLIEPGDSDTYSIEVREVDCGPFGTLIAEVRIVLVTDAEIATAEANAWYGRSQSSPR